MNKIINKYRRCWLSSWSGVPMIDHQFKAPYILFAADLYIIHRLGQPCLFFLPSMDKKWTKPNDYSVQAILSCALNTAAVEMTSYIRHSMTMKYDDWSYRIVMDWWVERSACFLTSNQLRCWNLKKDLKVSHVNLSCHFIPEGYTSKYTEGS